MGLTTKIITDFLNWLKPNHRQKIKKSQNYKILPLIIFFAGLFSVFAFVGMSTIRMMLKFLNLYGLIESYSEMVWLVYGLVLGISFAFFGQSFPSFERKDFSPELLYQSFKHHFKYFFYFILALVFWCGLILIILRFSGILQ